MSSHPTDDFSFERRIPDGDNLERLVCRECGWIHYENPRVIVGAVCTWDGQILLCKRAIEPRKNFWTIPAGFMEVGETSEAGAARESMEEANADIKINALLGVYNVPHLGQVQLIYRAELVSPDVSAGPESLAVKLVDWEEIPWKEIAFPTVEWALKHYEQSKTEQAFVPFGSPPDEVNRRLPHA